MWLALLTLSGAAHAGFHDDLATMNARGATMAAACGSVRRAVHGIEAVAAAIPPDAEKAEMLDRMRSFLSADPNAGAFPEDGGLVFALLPQGPTFVLHTSLDAASVAARLANMIDSGPPTPDATGFLVRDGRAPIHVRADRDGVWVEPGGAPPAVGAHPPVEQAVVDALPDLGEGCAMIGAVDDAKTGPTEFGIYVPLVGTEAGRFAVKVAALPGADKLAALQSAKPSLPPEVRTEQAPSGWISLGLRLADMDLSPLVKGPQLATAQRAQRALPVDAGLTVGVFLDPANPANAANPDVAMVVPLTRPWGPHKVLGHTRRLLKAAKASVQRLPGGRLAVTVEAKKGTTLYFGARRGELLLGSAPRLVDQLVAGTGEPWMRPEDRQRAAAWLLAMQVSLPVGFAGLPTSTPMWMGMRFEGDLVVGEAVLPLGPAGWDTVLKMAEAQRQKAKAKAP